MSRFRVTPRLCISSRTGRVRTVLVVLLILFAAFAAAIWFAPAIVARTSLVQSTLASYTGDFAAELPSAECRSAGCHP